jgi:uncharacterized Rmd1/YagE family protein
MGEKKAQWQQHLKAAEASGERLSAYAKRHQINVHRLYEAKRLRGQQKAAAWAVVRVKPEAGLEVSPKRPQRVAASPVVMQARLSNGVIVSWTYDASGEQILAPLMHALAGLPCSR